VIDIVFQVAKFLFVTALILIALGMGFIKANVTTFGAGQLYNTSDCAQKIQSYFRW
jgi:dipeptide/tripeptide permease